MASEATIRKFDGANMDIDLVSAPWKQDGCPWNRDDGSRSHRCAVKNVSICDYFCGVDYLDKVLRCYPFANPLADSPPD